MLTLRFIVVMLSLVVLGLGASTASGQDYPNRPIRIVSSQVGSSTDFLARLIAQAIADPLGQQVIIDNRVSVIRGQIVARALADGYTLLIAGAGLWIGPLMQETPYDAVKDFAPITITDRSPSVVVVHPSVPAKSVKEFMALAKARPGELNWSSGPTGGPAHLAGELFKSMAGINIVRVSYKSIGVGLNDVLSGDLQMAIPSPGLATPHMKAGKLRGLAVTTSQPSMLLPGLPTVAASGLPGYEFSQISGIFAPAKTPQTIITRLNHEIVRALNRDDVKGKILSTGTEVVASSPQQLAAEVKSEIAKWSKIIKDAGIKAE